MSKKNRHNDTQRPIEEQPTRTGCPDGTAC